MKLKKLLKKLNRLSEEAVASRLPLRLQEAIDAAILEAHKVITFIDEYTNKEVIAAQEEIPPFELSPKVLSSKKSLAEIFSDCSFYVYGYPVASDIEQVMAKNLKAGGYPFENISSDVIADGKITRFEIVSNTDLFCYMSGGIGKDYLAPMTIPCANVFVGSVFNASIKITGGII